LTFLVGGVLHVLNRPLGQWAADQDTGTTSGVSASPTLGVRTVGVTALQDHSAAAAGGRAGMAQPANTLGRKGFGDSWAGSITIRS